MCSLFVRFVRKRVGGIREVRTQVHDVGTKGDLLGLRQYTRSKQAGSRNQEIIKHSTDRHRQKRS